MNTFTSLFLVTIAISTFIQLWLSFRHMQHVAAHRQQVPAAFAEKISLQQHQKAADYTLSKSRFGMVEMIISNLLLLAWTLGGGLNFVDQLWRSLEISTLATGTGVIVSTFFIIALLEIPLSLYSKFVIENTFGFNHSSMKLYFTDLMKQAILGIILGLPLVYLVLWIMDSSGNLWWFYVWLVWISFIFLLMWIYPAWIAPWFNKFTPLDNKDLLQRINQLLHRCGFSSNGVFVMDGSKRSGHGNAYFTGFGTQKRIVFFDTLLNSLDNNEIEAVLAHELGHFKHKHVIKRMLSMALTSLASLALLGWLMQQDGFYSGLGVSTPSIHTALLLFLIIIPVFSFFLQPLSAFIMRRHEFEADAYAAKQTSALHLIEALVKLYSENASTLTPDPLFSAFHDSHPPAPVRIAFLSSKLNQTTAEGFI